MKIKIINPIARLLAYTRKRKQIVLPKKGKGSYNRKNKQRRVDISK
jgi:stalled ribosome alternative rescue factor ArfA